MSGLGAASLPLLRIRYKSSLAEKANISTKTAIVLGALKT
jgi:hypothetical protein